MGIELTLQSNSYLDFSFGTVIKGKEMQVFGEYFPMISPVLQECGIQPLCSYAILATNNPGQVPEQGALTHMPSVESFTQFYSDARFLKAKPLRDDAMTFLTDGNFFKPVDQVLSLDSEADFALVIAEGNPLITPPLLELAAAKDSPKKVYAGKTMSLHVWSDDAQQLMEGPHEKAEVFKIRFMIAGS